MPFARPILADLRRQARAALVGRLRLLVPTLRRWLVGDLADALAGMVDGQYEYLTWQVAQLFVSSADGDYIDRQGNELGVPRKGAAPAAGPVSVPGINGFPVPAGTVLQTTDSSVTYAVTAAATVAGGTATLTVIAQTAGAAGNQAAGGTLRLVSAVAGLTGSATVLEPGLTGGLDQEGDDSYKARILIRKRQPPQGGSRTDYIAWAKQVPAVTRAWDFPRNRGGGTVDVTVVCDGRADIIPTADDLAAVQTVLDGLRPAQVDCIVFAPTADPIAVTVSSLTPNTAPVQAAVRAALASLFAGTTVGGATFGDGVSQAAPGGVLLIEQVSGAIRDAAGVTGFDLVAPAADIVAAFGHIQVLGTVTLPALS